MALTRDNAGRKSAIPHLLGSLGIGSNRIKKPQKYVLCSNMNVKILLVKNFYDRVLVMKLVSSW